MKLNNFFKDLRLSIILTVPLFLFFIIFYWWPTIVRLKDGSFFWSTLFLILLVYLALILIGFLRKILGPKAILKSQPKKISFSVKNKIFRIFFNIITVTVYLAYFVFTIESYDLFPPKFMITWNGSLILTMMIGGLFLYLVLIIFIIIRVIKYGNYKYLLFGLILFFSFYFWFYYWSHKCYSEYLDKTTLYYKKNNLTLPENITRPDYFKYQGIYILCMDRGGLAD